MRYVHEINKYFDQILNKSKYINKALLYSSTNKHLTFSPQVLPKNNRDGNPSNFWTGFGFLQESGKKMAHSRRLL